MAWVVCGSDGKSPSVPYCGAVANGLEKSCPPANPSARYVSRHVYICIRTREVAKFGCAATVYLDGAEQCEYSMIKQNETEFGSESH